jgi:hypothetical protein
MQARKRAFEIERATPSGAVRLGRMTRVWIIVVAMLALADEMARAQTPDLDAARVQALEQALASSRQRALEAEREAYAAQTRLATELSLNSLQSGRDASAPSLAASLPNTMPYSLQGVSRDQAMGALAGQHAADEARILELQQQALARSNARILAVQPAL